MRQILVMVALALCACGNKKADKQEDKPADKAVEPSADKPAAPAAPAAAPSGGADPWQAPAGGGGAPAAAPDDPDQGGEAVPEAVEVAAATDKPGLIAQLCARDAACGCPIENCEAGFAKVTTLPTSVWACFVAQPCETLCAKNSGAPGTVLYKTCMEGKMPAAAAGGDGGARKNCRATSDCPGSHECCSGLCYEMGTSMWITACQMPTGKF